MFKNYLKTALRNLSRNKIYSVINITGLSIGLACAMLIILYVKDEVSYDRFHANMNNIYRIIEGQKGPNSNGRKMGITGFPQGPKFSAKIPEIKMFVRVKKGNEDIQVGNDIKSQATLHVDTSFLSVFSFPLLSGDPRTALSGPNSIVISEDEAQKQFGTIQALGKTVMIRKDNHLIPYNVTGIAKRCPQNSSIKFDFLLPFIEPAGMEGKPENWFSFFLTTYVVLTPHANITSVEDKMQHIYEEDARSFREMIEKQFKTKDQTQYLLQPFIDMHLNKGVSQEALAEASDPIYSYILSGIALFILFIACINFINLTVARSLKRTKEIGIRKVIGSDRKKLILQFLGESFLLCFAAFGFAIVLVEILLPLFNRISNKALSVEYLLDIKLIATYIALFAVTSLLAGFYPALVLSGYKPVDTLYGRVMLVGKNYLQKSLVVVQFSLASFLIIGTFIIFSQFNFLTNQKLGYDDSNLVLVNKSGLTRNEASVLKSELKKNAGILDVAVKDEGFSYLGMNVNGDFGMGAATMTIDESFLPLLRIPIVTGRNFSPDFPTDSSKSVLVNESFVEKAGWKNPIGQEVAFGNGPKYSVIGVVKDYHFEPLSKKIDPEVFSMSPQFDYGMAYIKIKPNTATASLKFIEETFKKLFPLDPYSYTFKVDENLKNYEAEARWKQIILFGAILTIFISCIGLFGLSVLSTEKRTKEIGIRKVLGASVRKVATSLSKDFLKLVIISLIISIPSAWIIANKWLQNYPYRIKLSWELFASAGILVILVALATVSFQSIKAALANPVKSLRAE